MRKKRKRERENQTPVESIRERKQRELARRIARIRRRRASYQRRIIGTAIVVFIILVIACALLPSDELAGYENKWNRNVTPRQAKVLQSLEENFK